MVWETGINFHKLTKKLLFGDNTSQWSTMWAIS